MNIFNSMKFACLCAMVIAAGVVSGCSKDNLEDIGSGTTQLKITAAIALPVQNKTGTTANKFSGNLSFTSGYIWVEKLEFEGILQNGNSIEREVNRSSRIDFATGDALPALDDIIIPAGTYSYVDIEVDLKAENSYPAILLEGTYVRSDGSTALIRFEFDSEDTFEAESTQTLNVNENSTLIGAIVIDPLTWFNNVPVTLLDNASVDANGVIVISEDVNDDIYDLVEEGLDESMESEFSS